jgi:hypothetical protein
MAAGPDALSLTINPMTTNPTIPAAPQALVNWHLLQAGRVVFGEATRQGRSLCWILRSDCPQSSSKNEALRHESVHVVQPIHTRRALFPRAACHRFCEKWCEASRVTESGLIPRLRLCDVKAELKERHPQNHSSQP